MAAELNTVLKHLRNVAAAEIARQRSDRQLVERFVADSDEAAFTVLVQRHSAMVLNVCWRVLQSDSDADDACQATFLVLARKASSIRKKDSVASWLHGVAYRAAKNLRTENVRRLARERQAAASKSRPKAEVTWREVQTILDEEIQRLPEELKGPVLLCYLEGKAHNEGAQQLGWSLTTFRGRLERGRKVLRKRLTQRGVALSGALLAAVLAEKAASAAVSGSFLSVLVKGALATETARGVVSAQALSLAQGVLQTMFWNKLKIRLAAVLLTVIAVSVGGLALNGLAGGGQEQRQEKAPQTDVKPQPTVVVTASYPGASAAVVADKVAVPIEQQVNGALNLLHLASRSTDDGKYLLAVTFKPGTNLDKALRAVQKRVALAMPLLPVAVQNEGITVKKKAPVRLIVSLTSPDGRYASLFLSNYATIQVKDELSRLAGVGEVVGFGQSDRSLRVWLDPAKLAGRQLSASDVVAAISEQNMQVAAGQVGQPPTPKGQEFQFTINSLGRLTDAKEFADIIVKAGNDGRIVRLKEVGRVELVPESGSYVSLNGQRAAVLGIYASGGSSPKELSRTVAARTAELGPLLPKGARLDVAFDFTANLGVPDGSRAAEYLLLDVPMPDNASVERKHETLLRCDKLLRKVAGVEDVLVLTENPFEIIRNQPCILVRLTPAGKRKASRDELMATIRTRLEKIPDVLVLMRDLARPGSFPGCGYPIDLAVSGPEADKVRDLAQKLAEQLQKSKKMTDVWANRERAPRPRLHLRLDLRPMVELTANSAAEVSLVECRTLCEKLFEQVRTESRLPAEYRLTWLQEIPTGK
jgi:RNA polymerase sigma factor (sigma-70 family)